MTTIKIQASGLNSPAAVEALYDHIDQTCLVMIDRSMWFAKSYEALAVDDFRPLVQKHPRLAKRQPAFRKPLVFAFSYAQRVFLCSAMELCLLHQHTNSVLLVSQLRPTRVDQLVHLLDLVKRKHGIKSKDAWDRLSWDDRLVKLRELSFSNLNSALALFGDIYGSDCFDLAWSKAEHQRLKLQYEAYQTVRNGIVHRGGESSSGVMIEATEADISAVFEDAKRFRDSIRALSKWCRDWCGRAAQKVDQTPLGK